MYKVYESSTSDLKAMAQRLTALGIPYTISEDPGDGFGGVNVAIAVDADDAPALKAVIAQIKQDQAIKWRNTIRLILAVACIFSLILACYWYIGTEASPNHMGPVFTSLIVNNILLFIIILYIKT